MKIIVNLFLISLLPAFLQAQSSSEAKVPRLSKQPIGQSGCAAYFPEGMPAFALEKSEDGADVYTSEMEAGGHYFGCIAVKFAEPFEDSTPDEMEDLLIAYMDFLQEQLGITSAAGYGKGHRQDDHPEVRGILDYWQDADETEYVVKGWIDQQYIGVMYIYGSAEYPHANLQQMYLDGFRFGG